MTAPPGTNPFDLLARFYDWEHADFLEDVPLYLGLARRTGGPILEAGCGSGRLVMPLARAGYDVVGLDSSTAMLDLARARLHREPTLAQRVRLVEGDVRTVQLGEQFRLVIVALDSFGLLTEQGDQLQALQTLGRHLRSDGLLVLDVANGNLRGGEAEEETLLHRHGLAPDRQARQLMKWVVRRTDHAAQIDRLLQIYDELDDDGRVRRTCVEVELRYFTRFELQLLLERAGYKVEALYGDYDLAPYGPNSQRLIAVARRP